MAPGGATRSARQRRRLLGVAVTVLLVQMAVQMLLSASGDAPTNDEPAHLGSGLAYTRRHDLRFSPEHPPVAKVIATVPLLAARIHLPPRHAPSYRSADPFAFGREILYSSGNDPLRLIWLARLPMVALTLVLALVVFGFGRDLFGAVPALLSLAVVSLCPTVLAHGRLVTTDVAGALFALCTAWFLWKAADGRSWLWFPAAGAAFGLALASKLSAVFLLPVVVGLALAAAHLRGRKADDDRGRRLVRVLGWPPAVLAVAIATVWLVYLAIDPGLRFDVSLPLASGATGGLAGLADVVPLPKAYRVGLRIVVATDQAERGSFLLGEHYQGGRLLFYPALLLMKTPVATLLLWVLAAVAVIRSEGRCRSAAFVGAVPAILFTVGLLSETNLGIRHVVVVPIFLAVAVGAVPVLGLPARAYVLGGLVLLSAASVWTVFPHHLQYVNEAFGGPSRAPELMSDSNVDWGQDLGRLSEYLEDRYPGQPVWLAYFGSADPAAYGIRNSRDPATVPPDQVKGVVAVSVTLVNSFLPDRYDFITERHRPVDTVGHSILIYRIS